MIGLIENPKDTIKKLCQDNNDMTFKELAEKAGMNDKGLHNKFSRDSITLRDFQSLLKVLNHELSIIKIQDK